MKTYWYMIPEDTKPERRSFESDSLSLTALVKTIAADDFEENGAEMPRYTIIFFESETGPELYRYEVLIEMKPTFTVTEL